MMKKMLLLGVLGMWSVHVAAAQTVPAPVGAPSGSVQVPATNGDMLDKLSERIGDGRAYRLTRKGSETIVCTLQGRTNTNLIVNQCHFRVVHQVITVNTHKEAFPYWTSDQPEYTEVSDADAIKMLETKPAQFHGTDVMYGGFGPNSHGILNAYQLYHIGDSIKVAEADVVQVEYINLPASALPADAPPTITTILTPERINPSLFSVWPPPTLSLDAPKAASKQR